MFKDAKVGDRVWSFIHGWGEVTEIYCDRSPYTIRVLFGDNSSRLFTVDGKWDTSNPNPILFWDEIKFEIPVKPKRIVKKWFGIFYLSVRNEWRVCGHGMTPALYNSLDEAEEDNTGIDIKKFFEIEVEE